MNFKFIVLAFFLGFFLSLGIRISCEATTFKPYYWDSHPNVVNCYGDDLHESYMTKAVGYWRAKGEKINSIILNPTKEECSEEFVRGNIIIRKAYSGQLDSKVLAITQRHSKGSKILGMAIYFNPDKIKLENLIEHEFGHAFGYTHISVEGHIMHPIYEKMGNKFWIP